MLGIYLRFRHIEREESKEDFFVLTGNGEMRPSLRQALPVCASWCLSLHFAMH